MRKLALLIIGAVGAGVLLGAYVSRDIERRLDCSTEKRLEVYQRLGSDAGTDYAARCREQEVLEP